MFETCVTVSQDSDAKKLSLDGCLMNLESNSISKLGFLLQLDARLKWEV